METSQSKNSNRNTFIVFGGIMLAGAIGVFFLTRASASSCSLVVATATAGADNAVVACRSWGGDKVAPDLALWTISLSDGRALNRVEIERDTNEWVNVIGQQGDRLWVRVDDHGLRAYGLPDLTSVRNLDDALASHSVLSRGMTNNAWVSSDGAVLQGKDKRKYLVALDGTIERFERTNRDTWSVSDKGPATVNTATRESGEVVRPDAEALVQPRILASQGEPLWVDQGDGVLAISVDIGGIDGNDRLSKLDSTGKPIWTVATEELMRAAGAGNGGPCRLRDIDVTQAAIWATIVCTGYSFLQGERRMHVDSRLVALDPATGKTRIALEPHVAD